MTDHTRVIKEYIVEEFLPDVPLDDLDTDYDLLTGGVIDSLGVLQVMVWLEDTFDVPIEDADAAPEDFRSVASISAFVERARNARADAA